MAGGGEAEDNPVNINVVPMVDVFVEMPGATPADVEQRVTRPLEQLLWEVPGVEYIYSTSSSGRSLIVVRFKVDEPQEPALVRLNQKLAANADRIPPDAIGPVVKPRSIDDVPILAVTAWSERYGDDQLRSLAAQLQEAIAEVDDVSEVAIIGGRPAPMDADYVRLIADGRVHLAFGSATDVLDGLVVLIPEPDTLLVENVAVRPALHGRGIGRGLLAFAEDEARRLGLPAVRLYTNAKMTRNIVLYEALGYTVTGHSPLEGRGQIVLMRKEL